MAEEQTPDAISAISIKGFKSFFDEQRIEIRPLTLLAGANSSGKTSALQPLLLLKQTLEAPVDAGPLDLYGPHVRFTSTKQLLPHPPGQEPVDEFEIGIDYRSRGFREVFRRTPEDGLDLVRMTFLFPDGRSLVVEPGLSSQELMSRFPSIDILDQLEPLDWKVTRDRCFLQITSEHDPLLVRLNLFSDKPLRSIIHVPGLRGSPERTYPTTPVEEYFRGEFTNYAASIVASWQRFADARLNQLLEYLELLGLTSALQAESVEPTRFELLVGRTLKSRSLNDLVNIADVGFGVSQVLPVLVALLVAKPGQLVFLEQPEFHLHPRAEQALATVLADAANRGVRVVAETHSSILLVAVQALVAEGKLSPDVVKLHWFTRDARGATKVTSANLDELGAYGDWPVDFGEVEAAVDNRYLDAVESQAYSRKRRAKK